MRALGSYGSAIERFETTASGLGRTSGQTAEQLEAIAEAASSAGERSISATRDSVAAFAAAGIQGEQTLTSLAGMVDKYAKLTGQDAPAAQAALAAAMSDPARLASGSTPTTKAANDAATLTLVAAVQPAVIPVGHRSYGRLAAFRAR